MTSRRFVRLYKGIFIYATLIFVVAIGVIVGLIPAVEKIYSMQQDTSALSSDIALLRVKANFLDQLDESTLRTDLLELASAVPTDKSLSSLFATIDGLSSKTGVSLSDFTLLSAGNIATSAAQAQTEEEKKIGSNLLPFIVKVQGGYGEIRDFLDQSVRVRRLFRVRNFDIVFANTSDISVRMGMDAFYSQFPTILESVGQPLVALAQSEADLIARVSSMPVLGQTVTAAPSSLVGGGTPKANPFAP